ncbi:MAG: hypothetical protein GY822_06420 [Deltaproteobacteria bacterium]|nr:hypothetical protein [Deltaproteobacteria bacterium]
MPIFAFSSTVWLLTPRQTATGFFRRWRVQLLFDSVSPSMSFGDLPELCE